MALSLLPPHTGQALSPGASVPGRGWALARRARLLGPKGPRLRCAKPSQVSWRGPRVPGSGDRTAQGEPKGWVSPRRRPRPPAAPPASPGPRPAAARGRLAAGPRTAVSAPRPPAAAAGWRPRRPGSAGRAARAGPQGPQASRRGLECLETGHSPLVRDGAEKTHLPPPSKACDGGGTPTPGKGADSTKGPLSRLALIPTLKAQDATSCPLKTGPVAV